MELSEFKRGMARAIFGRAPEDTPGLCINCGQSIEERCYSEAGRKEGSISGLCEVCFDTLTE